MIPSNRRSTIDDPPIAAGGIDPADGACARHLARKDLRRLRWTLLAWCACLAARVLVAAIGPDIGFAESRTQAAVGQMDGLLAIVEVLLLGLLVSRLVHDEPLVGYDAFWLTRPIAPRALMCEKLALASLFFLVVPIGADVVVMVAFGTRLHDVLHGIPVSLVNRLVWLAALMAIAVLTPSLVRYVLALVGSLAAVAVLSAVTSLAAFVLSGPVNEDPRNWVPADPTPMVMRRVLLIVVALAVIAYQYRTRRLMRAIAGAIAGAAMVYVLAGWWPWSFATRLDALRPAPFDRSVAVSFDRTQWSSGSESSSVGGRQSVQRVFHVKLVVTGLPEDVAVQAIDAESRLELPDTTLTSAGRGAFIRLGGMGLNSRKRSIVGALGGARLLRERDFDDLRPDVLRVSDSDFHQYGSQSGRLSTTLNVLLNRSTLAGTMPLAGGAAVDVGSTRVRIAAIVPGPTRWTVLLRHSYVDPLFAMPAFREFVYLLRNTSRNEAMMGGSTLIWRGGLSGPLGMFFSQTRSGLQVEHYDVQFPSEDSRLAPARIDPAWMSGAELLIVETAPAGAVTRQLEIADFRMRR